MRATPSQMETAEPEASRSNHSPESLAEDLASAVLDIALREISRGHKDEGFQSSASSGAKTSDAQPLDEAKTERDALSTDTEMDPVGELQSSKDTQLCRPPLAQSGLPVVGSLDYPDAPPTTPLLPELERSRHSFARKLKGGLAKVFLPSPPPPTPKEKEDDSDGTVPDSRMELMEHLMHSLCTDDVAGDDVDAGSQHGATMEAFAEALSREIIKGAFSCNKRQQKGNDSGVHLLARQLAETIITSSIDEARMLI